MRYNNFCSQFFVLDWREGAVRESNTLSTLLTAQKQQGERLIFMDASIDYSIFAYYSTKRSSTRITISLQQASSNEFEHFISGYVVFVGKLAGNWWVISADGSCFAFPNSILQDPPTLIGKVTGGISCISFLSVNSADESSSQVAIMGVNRTFRLCTLDSSPSLTPLCTGTLKEIHAQESILKIHAVKERGIVGFFVGSHAEARISRVLLYSVGEEGGSLSFLKAFEAPKGFEFVSLAACGESFLSLLLVSSAESLVLTLEAVGSEQVRKTSFPVVIHDMTAVHQSPSNGALLRILVNGTSTEYFGIDSTASNETKQRIEYEIGKEHSGAFLSKMCSLKDSQELVHNCIAFYMSLVNQTSSSAVPSLGANYKALVKGYFLLDNSQFQEAFAHFCSPHIVADWEMDILRAFISTGRSDLAYRYYIYSGRITFVALEERLLFIEMLINTDNAIEALLQARLWSLSAEFVRILCANSAKLCAFLEASVILKAEEAAVLVNCLCGINSEVLFSQALGFALKIGDLECAKSISVHCRTPLAKLFVQLNGKPQHVGKPEKSIERSGELNATSAKDHSKNDDSESVVTAGMLSTPRAASKRPSEKFAGNTNEKLLQMPQFFSPKKKHTPATSNDPKVVEEQVPLYRIDPSGKNKPAVSSTLAFSLMEDAEIGSGGESGESAKELDNLVEHLENDKQEEAKSLHDEQGEETVTVTEAEAVVQCGNTASEEEIELSSDEIYLQDTKMESEEPQVETKAKDANIQPQEPPHQTDPLKSTEQSSPSIDSIPLPQASSSHSKKPKKARRKRSLIQSPVLSTTSLQLPLQKVKPSLSAPATKKQKKSSSQGSQTPSKNPADKQEFSTPMSTRRTLNK